MLRSETDMLRVQGENHKSRPAPGDIQSDVLAGLTEVAFLVASSGGVLGDAELDSLAHLIVTWTDCGAREGDVYVQIESCQEALEVEGFDARLNAILRRLPTLPLRLFALSLGAEVFHANSSFRLDREGEIFVSLGLSMGVPYNEVLACLRDVQQRSVSREAE